MQCKPSDLPPTAPRVNVAELHIIDVLFDRFVDANNQAIAAIGNAIDQVRGTINGEPQRVSALDLSGTIFGACNATLEAYEKLSGGNAREFCTRYKHRLEELSARVHTEAEQLDFLFKHGYHLPTTPKEDTELKGCNSLVRNTFITFREILARSKPEAVPTTIDTVEEWARTLHSTAVSTMTQFLAEDCLSLEFSSHYKQGNSRKELAIQHFGLFSYLGSKSEQEFFNGPQGRVARAIAEFMPHVEYGFNFSQATFTDRAFFAHAELGHHHLFIQSVWDATANCYDVCWSLNEPAYGDGRIKYCAELFPLLGFRHTVSGWSHSACKRVSADDIDCTIKKLLFISQGLRDLDMGHAAQNPAQRLAAFERFYRHDSIVRGRTEAAMHVDPKDFARCLDQWPNMTERQKRILVLVLAEQVTIQFPSDLDSKPEPLGRLRYCIQAATKELLRDYIDDFFSAGASLESLRDLFCDAARVIAAFGKFLPSDDVKEPDVIRSLAMQSVSDQEFFVNAMQSFRSTVRVRRETRSDPVSLSPRQLQECL